MVVVSEQIVQSAVNSHVGYKVLHPALQAHNDCSDTSLLLELCDGQHGAILLTPLHTSRTVYPMRIPDRDGLHCVALSRFALSP